MPSKKKHYVRLVTNIPVYQWVEVMATSKDNAEYYSRYDLTPTWKADDGVKGDVTFVKDEFDDYDYPPIESATAYTEKEYVKLVAQRMAES